MLDSKKISEIESFVAQKPRSIQELAIFLKKNWRTADRYVEEIKTEFGTLSTRVFREGTRGALKIVYLENTEKISSNSAQKRLEEQILSLKHKEDFQAFDIFQYVQDNKKSAWIKEGEDEVKAGRIKEFKTLLMKAEKEILFMSGNLSFINFKDKETDIFKTLEYLVEQGVRIKVVCRVDLAGIENVKKLLSLNFKYGVSLIEVRHKEQPIRASIIDGKIINLKDTREPTKRNNELNKKIFVIYTITDKDWATWLSRIFNKMFNESISAEKRIIEIGKVEGI